MSSGDTVSLAVTLPPHRSLRAFALIFLFLSGNYVMFAGAVPVSGPGELLRVYPGVGPGSAQLTWAELNDGQLGVVLSGTAAAVKVPSAVAGIKKAGRPRRPAPDLAGVRFRS